MDIFRSSADYQDYLRHLKGLLQPMGMRLHAYCLMPNHAHLLVESLTSNLSRMMERLHGWYARRHNWREQRVGHVFQGRFMAKRIADDSYLMEVGRYIHMNPIKAGLAQRPENYAWSSFPSYLTLSADGLLTRDKLLDLHGRDRTRLYSFTTAGFDGISDSRGWPIAPWYEDDVLTSTVAGCDRLISDGLLASVASEFGLKIDELRVRRNGKPLIAQARAAAAFALRSRSALTLKQIAAELGFRNVNSLCNRMRWIQHQAPLDADLSSRLGRLGLGDYLGELR